MTKIIVRTSAPEELTIEAFAAFLAGISEIGPARVDAMSVGQLRNLHTSFWDKFDAAQGAGEEMFAFNPTTSAESFNAGQPRDSIGRWASTGGGGGAGGGTGDGGAVGGGGGMAKSALQQADAALNGLSNAELESRLEGHVAQLKNTQAISQHLEATIGRDIYRVRNTPDPKTIVVEIAATGNDDARLNLRPLVTQMNSIRPNMHLSGTSWLPRSRGGGNQMAFGEATFREQ